MVEGDNAGFFQRGEKLDPIDALGIALFPLEVSLRMDGMFLSCHPHIFECTEIFFYHIARCRIRRQHNSMRIQSPVYFDRPRCAQGRKKCFFSLWWHRAERVQASRDRCEYRWRCVFVFCTLIDTATFA